MIALAMAVDMVWALLASAENFAYPVVVGLAICALAGHWLGAAK